MKSLSSLFLHAAKMGIPPQVFWQLLLLGLTVQPSEEVEAVCSGTTCYTLNFGRFSWMEAQQKCKDNGGNLMTLKSQEEALLVPQLLTEMPKGEAGTVSEVRLWIGLHRKKGKCYEKHRPLRGFCWVTGEDTQYSKWGQEPRETCLSNMCVTLQGTPFSSQELSWVDSLCGNATAGLSGFLCKFSFQGMCRPLILAGPGVVSYSTPFGVATDFLVTVPFGSMAEVACEPQGEEIPNTFLVCKPQPSSNVSEWSSPGPFCASLTYGCSYNNGGCEHECLNEGKGLFQCACRSGYQLGGDHLSCVPVDYCSSNPCQGQCKPYPGGFQCLCASGYILADDERSCIDVNECGVPQSPCEQICVNTKGSFTCRCNLGYMPAESDHQACQDIDECARNTPCDQICVNTHGSFHCSCQPGYQLEAVSHLEASAIKIYFLTPFGARESDLVASPPGTTAEVQSLGAVLECRAQGSNGSFEWGSAAPGAWDCQLQNGGCDDQCHLDEQGRPHCACLEGKTLLEDERSCWSPCASLGCQQHCEPQGDSGVCMCFEGYELDSDGKSCLDIDDCQATPGLCEQECINTQGAFECRCWQGYDLVKGKCLLEKWACFDLTCEHDCNLVDGEYKCTCFEGYIPDPKSPHKCLRVCNQTECAAQCDPHSINECYCPENFIFQEKTDGMKVCTDINECESGFCGSLKCINTPGSYNCICPNGLIQEVDSFCEQPSEEPDEFSGETETYPKSSVSPSFAPPKDGSSPGTLVAIIVSVTFTVVMLVLIICYLVKKRYAAQSISDYKSQQSESGVALQHVSPTCDSSRQKM